MDVSGGGDAERKAALWLRLCICSMKRGILRREDILEHVFKGENSRNFSTLFETVQERLRNLFGMEMVAVPNKNMKQKSNSFYIQSSICHEKRLPLLASLSHWKENEELRMSGLLFLILATIYTQGGRLPDNSLSNYMLSFGFTRDSKDLRVNPVFGTLEDCLTRFLKQGYLERVKCREEEGAGACVWSWGSRSKVEIGKEGIERWIMEIYGDDATEALQKELDRADSIDGNI